MASLRPTVRSLTVCESIHLDPHNGNRVSLVNLISRIRSRGRPPFPLRYPALSVFAQLTECRGTANLRIEVRAADTD